MRHGCQVLAATTPFRRARLQLSRSFLKGSSEACFGGDAGASRESASARRFLNGGSLTVAFLLGMRRTLALAPQPRAKQTGRCVAHAAGGTSHHTYTSRTRTLTRTSTRMCAHANTHVRTQARKHTCARFFPWDVASDIIACSLNQSSARRSQREPARGLGSIARALRRGF